MKGCLIFCLLFFGVQILAAWAGATVVGAIGEAVLIAVVVLGFRAWWRM